MEFIIVADNMVMKSGLPDKWKIIFIAPFGYGEFKGTDH